MSLAQGEKVDVYLKRVGVPFPESPKINLQPRAQGEDLWFDRWAYLWGQKPEEWYAKRRDPPAQQLSGTFSQDLIDRMQRDISSRKRGRAEGGENPLYAWQDQYGECRPSTSRTPGLDHDCSLEQRGALLLRSKPLPCRVTALLSIVPICSLL